MGNKGTKEYQEAVREMADHMFGDIMCESCKHYHGVNSCDAFPKQIPLDIIAGERLHIHPYPGDRGIQYERKEESL